MTRRLLRALIITVASIGLIEIGLRWFDPLGVNALYGDIRTLLNDGVPDPRGYALAPGVHTFTHWQALIESERVRLVPDTLPDAACDVAILGDSVAFGWGLNDDETAVNVLAQEFPVHFINTALPGYGIDNVIAAFRHFKADAYLYLLIDNDAESLALDFTYTESWHPAIQYYLLFARRGSVVRSLPAGDDFWPKVKLLIDAGVTVVAYEGVDLPQQVHDRFGVPIVPAVTHRISQVDPHPNADGARELAAALRPFVAELVAAKCGGK